MGEEKRVRKGGRAWQWRLRATAGLVPPLAAGFLAAPALADPHQDTAIALQHGAPEGPLINLGAIALSVHAESPPLDPTPGASGILPFATPKRASTFSISAIGIGPVELTFGVGLRGLTADSGANLPEGLGSASWTAKVFLSSPPGRELSASIGTAFRVGPGEGEPNATIRLGVNVLHQSKHIILGWHLQF